VMRSLSLVWAEGVPVERDTMGGTSVIVDNGDSSEEVVTFEVVIDGFHLC
jgi:hypothetical protein